MNEPTLLPVIPEPTIDAEAIAFVETILAAMKAGTVTAFAIVAKEDGYSRWSSVRAYNNRDRYNLIGQIQCVINELVDLEAL